MKKIISMVMVMAMAMSINAYAYDADEVGIREATNRTEWVEPLVEMMASTALSLEPAEDSGEELTREEKIAINHDENDPRWFDIEDCDHPTTTPYPCWSPDEGDFWEDECDICHTIVNTRPVEAEEEEDEEICPHDRIVQSDTYTRECADCGAEIDGWMLPEDDPNDLPDDGEDGQDTSEMWVDDTEDEDGEA